MEFKSDYELDLFLKSLIMLDCTGSQGTVYVDGKREFVYKIFHFYEDGDLDYIDSNLTKDNILKFKDFPNSCYLFASNVISLNGRIIGYIAPYRKGINLYRLNPLTIDLEWLKEVLKMVIKEVIKISKCNVNSYDVMYNIMLGDGVYITDPQDFTLRERNFGELFSHNMMPINLEFMYFLVDGIFEEIVKDNSELKGMLESSGEGFLILDFISLLKSYLEQLLGKKIRNLGDAIVLGSSDIINNRYQRSLVLQQLK